MLYRVSRNTEVSAKTITFNLLTCSDCLDANYMPFIIDGEATVQLFLDPATCPTFSVSAMRYRIRKPGIDNSRLHRAEDVCCVRRILRVCLSFGFLG